MYSRTMDIILGSCITADVCAAQFYIQNDHRTPEMIEISMTDVATLWYFF